MNSPSASSSRAPTRALMLALLYALPILLIVRPVIDVDIWWHLRQAQWILAHGEVPTTDAFSVYGLGRRWIAYSWLFELAVYALFRAFGLAGLVSYTVAVGVLITAALHALIWRLRPEPGLATLLTGVGILTMGPVLVHPRPWLLTILFFVVEVGLITIARQSDRSPRPLLFLPPLFALWANVHIQFVYGLFVLAIATVEALITGGAPREAACRPRFRWLLAVLLLSALATLANPYGFRVYLPVFEAIVLTKPFLFLQELTAPHFRSLFDWLMLLLTLAAVFLLGRRGDVRSFPAFLLAAGAFLSFRAARDVWFVTVAALVVLAESWPGNVRSAPALPRRWIAGVVGLVIALTALTGWSRLGGQRLDATIAATFPAAAAAVVEERRYPGPIYNHYDWGGYLVWRLPHLLVGLDGRNPLHGDDRILRSVATWEGQPGWDRDPELLAAGVVIGSARSPLVSLLRLDSRFELAYEDPVAAVFVPHRRRQ